MINNLRDLLDAVGSYVLPQHNDTRVRVYLNGRYMIEEVTVSQDDGAIILWLNERGDQGE